MGIRFHCDHCDKRLNVKAKQAGTFCVCPDCQNEIQIPHESTVKPAGRSKKKRRGKKSRPVEVELSPLTTEAKSLELQPVVDPAATVVSVAPKEVVASTIATSEKPTIESVSDQALVVAAVETPAAVETMIEKSELNDSTPEASFGDQEEMDSEAALEDLLSSDEREVPDENSSESFLLAKPVAKIGDDPLKANPNLVWYLRHKRLGEKGPLKARQVEEMLEAGQIRVGYIVWREDWNDWVPAEEVFQGLNKPAEDESAYRIPAELNPHSEASRKRRAQKRFWMCFNAAAFLLVVVLVYWITHYVS